MQATLRFIFITLLIDATGFGIILPVMPRLIETLTGNNLSVASQYGGWLSFSYAIMLFLCSPILGALSDRFGRRPVLLCSLLGLGIDYIFLSFAPSVGWLFLGRIIAGIGGASYTTATAYVADISPPEKRSQNFGITGAAFGLGFIIGPVIGGLSSHWGIRAPFMVAAALSLLNCLYGYFVLPESLARDKRRPFEWKRANPVGALAQMRKYPLVTVLLLAFVLIAIAHHCVESTWTYYTIEKFGWSEAMIGLSLGAAGIGIALVQGWLIRYIIPRLGQRNAVYAGMLLRLAASLLYAFAGQGWMMFAILAPDALSFILAPAMQGLMSNEVPDNAQGELQGLVGSTYSLCAIIGPVLMTNLFAWTTHPGTPVYFPGSPFIMSAVLILISITIVFVHFKKEKHHGSRFQTTGVSGTDTLPAR